MDDFGMSECSRSALCASAKPSVSDRNSCSASTFSSETHGFVHRRTRRKSGSASEDSSASDNDSESDEATSAEGASARRCTRRLAHARADVCTVRGEHEIYGDERGRLTNNKSKGSKAHTQAISETLKAVRGAIGTKHWDPLFWT